MSKSSRRAFLRAHPDVAHELPHPDEEWMFNDLDVSFAAFHKLIGTNAVYRVRWVSKHSDALSVWATRPETFEWVHSTLDKPETLPCGHQGVRCLVSGESYTCFEDDCDRTYGRDIAEKVVFA